MRFPGRAYCASCHSIGHYGNRFFCRDVVAAWPGDLIGYLQRGHGTLATSQSEMLLRDLDGLRRVLDCQCEGIPGGGLPDRLEQEAGSPQELEVLEGVERTTRTLNLPDMEI